jgi:hypothetical protein
VKKCKQQSRKDLQARHQQIRNRLSAAQVRFISPGENRRDLGHVPQLFFALFRGKQALLCDVWAEVADPPIDFCPSPYRG